MSAVKSKPSAEPFVMLPRSLLQSAAWRAQGINCRRVVDFLMLEHLSHGGKENGKLKAPHRQLVDFGVCGRHTAEAIREAEELGLVRCRRGGMRVATSYALTWMATSEGPATHDWRRYIGLPRGSKFRNLPEKGKAGLPEKGKADGANLPEKGKADAPKTLPEKGKALSRNLLTRKPEIYSVSKGGRVVPLRASGTPGCPTSNPKAQRVADLADLQPSNQTKLPESVA